jgi:lysophospholipase L1-like esterase
LVGELVVRFFEIGPRVYPIHVTAADNPYMVSDDPLLRYVPRPNFRAKSAKRTVDAVDRINAWGFRDIERTRQKPPGARRILLVGDSVVMGVGVDDVNDTISRRLERKLQAQNVEILNFGVSGYNTVAEAELVRVKGLAFSPDLAIVVFLCCDFGAFIGQNHHFSTERPEWADELFVGSRLFRTAAMRLNLFGFRLQYDRRTRDQRPSPVPMDDNVGRGIAMFREMSAEHAFRAVFMLWPSFTDAAIVSARTGIAGCHVDYDMATAAQNAGLAAFDLAPYFQEDFDDVKKRFPHAAPRTTYTFDGVHPLPYGVDTTVRILERLLGDLGYGPRAPDGGGEAAGGEDRRGADPS